MLKIILYSAAVAALAFAVSVVGFSGWRLLNQTKGSDGDAIATYTFWLMIFTGVLAVVALIQIGFLIAADHTAEKTANAARDAADISRAAMRLDQRAWISVDWLKPEPLIPTVGQLWQATVRFTNTGKTPARRITGSAIADPVARGNSPDFAPRPGEKTFAMGYMPPGGEGLATVHPFKNGSTGQPVPVTQLAFDALSREDVRLYIHGRVDYEDIFGVKHWMKFCSVLMVPFNERFGVDPVCAPHNDSDDYQTPK